jgi:RNA polymerase sigma-70 factor, ECF subfamily
MIAITAQSILARLHMLNLTTFSLRLALLSQLPDEKAGNDLTESDMELAMRAPSDRHAFTALYQRYLKCIYRYHLARTGHIQEAEDLTAQTFLTALESIRSFRGQGSFKAWLFGIASHKLADHFRHSRADLPLEEADGLHSPLPLPEDAAHHRLEIARVARVLGQISPHRAEALVLCLFGGLSLREAANTLGKSEAAVKMLVQRGICDLQERLAAHLEVAL